MSFLNRIRGKLKGMLVFYQFLCDLAQRDPEVFVCAMCFIGSLVYQGHTTTHFQDTSWFFGFPAEGGKAKDPLISWNCVFLLTSVPQASKNHLANKNTSGSFWFSQFLIL